MEKQIKVLMINSVPYGSPAKIMYGIAKLSKLCDIDTLTSTGYSSHPDSNTPTDNIIISGFFSKSIHMLLSRISGFENCFSVFSTLRLIKIIKKFNPNIIHLHNLHGWYINLPLLSKYIKKMNIKVVWTLHDCWALTGHCTHFESTNCYKWRENCCKCKRYKEYPMSMTDNSSKMHKLKKKYVGSLKDLIIVTPSQWLSNYVRESYLKDRTIYVINNGIDLQEYKPIKSNFRIKMNCENKKMILGVAHGWNSKKGLDVFIKLAEDLGENYKIILVGTDKEIDKVLPKNIISVHRTENKSELIEIYSAVDIFVNPTIEDNFPTVNIEALACGTPVITYATGGSPEIIDESCGVSVKKGDYLKLKETIEVCCSRTDFTTENCIRRANMYEMNDRFMDYVSLYKKMSVGEL
jgi:glycosyltransferase involved in cell wall biosynthesis